LSQGVEENLRRAGMLFAATHREKRHFLPVLTNVRRKNAGLHITYGRELGFTDDMNRSLPSRIYESLGLESQNPPKTYTTHY